MVRQGCINIESEDVSQDLYPSVILLPIKFVVGVILIHTITPKSKL